MIKNFKENRIFIRYKKYFRFLFFCAVGGASTLIHFIFFNFFRFWVMFSFIFSLILAICFSMIFNFSVNRNVTFSAREYSIKKQLPRYLIIYVISMGSNFFTALFIKNLLGNGFVQENTALLIGLAVSIPISFFGSLLWIFKKK